MTVWACPAWVEDALWDAAPDVPRGELVDAIRKRSIAYTREREQLGRLRGDADLAARALFFGVADAAKVMVPLAELAARGLLPEGSRPVRILDAGAGTGAMSFGAAAALGRPVEVVAVDRDGPALALFEDAFAATGRGRIATVCADVDEPRWGGGTFDLVLAGSLFNEVLDEHHVGLARDLLGALADGGSLVVVEPALRETTRALHRLRDALLDAGDARVFAPCLRRGTPCPMLADERDWCHEDRPTALPPRAAALAAATGLRERGLKFSYLTLRRDAARLSDAANAARVVSQLDRPKGKLEAYVCDDRGRTKLRLLRRNRAASNRAFERASRGDVLLVPDTDDLTAGDTVERVEV